MTADPNKLQAEPEEAQGGEPCAPDASEAPEASEVTELRQMVTDLEAEADRLGRERDELLDRTLRLQADFDNFRRRTREEVAELRRTAAADLIRELLPALDNLDRALAAAEAEGDPGALRQGVALTRDQLFVALAGAGLEPVPAVGQSFDPNLHEALEREGPPEAPGEAGRPAELEVVEEYRRGYLVRGKLLRPSLVKVASKGTEGLRNG